MKSSIEDRFDQNIARVKNLLNIYAAHLAGSGPGRRSPLKTDVLRAAVVFLHASLEDLLRSLAYWKLPHANSCVLSDIPLVSANPAKKFTLGQLADHRGQTVEDVIGVSVKSYLERSNYNNTDDIATLLGNIGVQVANVNSYFSQLDDLMSRRHQIVHRADGDETGGSGNHRVRSIGPTQLNSWVSTVKSFGHAVLNEVT